MSRTLRVIRFLFWRRLANSIKRLPRQPAQLLPLLLIVPGALLAVVMAAMVLFVPAYDITWSQSYLDRLHEYAGEGRSAIMIVLLAIAFSLLHRALEEDLLAFRRAEVDFLFPTPVSMRAILVARLATDYLYCGLATFTLVLYALAPIRIVAPSIAGPGWAIQTWAGVLLLYVAIMNTGRLAQAALSAGRRSGLTAAKVLRVVVLLVAVTLMSGLIWDRAHGNSPLDTMVGALSSKTLYWALLPCSLVADMFVAPLVGGVEMWSSLGILAGAAIITGGLVIALAGPTVESSLPATDRRHALWQAFRKADASSIRAAQLAGRPVHGSRRGLMRLGSGAWALAAKSIVYGLRNRPRGLVVVGFLALSPAVLAPLMEQTSAARSILSAAPLLMLTLIFAWSQRIRLNVREEFSHLSILKSLPLSPYAILLAFLVVPTIGFSAFLITAGMALVSATSAVPKTEVLAVLSITPGAYVALGSLHLCSGLIYPSYEPGLGKGYVADLVFLPVAGIALLGIVAAAGAAVLNFGGLLGAALAGNAAALGVLLLGLGTAGFLYDRFEPAT